MKVLQKKNTVGAAIIALVYIITKVLIDGGAIPQHISFNLFIIGINIILAVSLNLITGFTGQFSLGHAAFMSVGAYTSAVITSNFGQPFFVGLIAAAVTAALAGLIIGIPTLRLKGDYLAIATLGFCEIIQVLILNNEYLGGATGFNDIPNNTTWTWLFFMVVLTMLFISNFVKSFQGRACIAIREDEIAAEAMGVNTTKYKVMAFVIGAVFAGIAGALYSGYVNFIKPTSFDFMRSIDILVMVVFGGIGSITGAALGAVALVIISTLLQSIPELRMVVYAVILFVIMVYRPQGLLGKGNLNFINRFLKKGGSINGNIDSKESI
ncbi:branched-chain amino acid ABC transporter permease [Clostridium thermarum]|uniref:branched-chain amino acid ABC transporter permease n=1 Tax=Clostridium thermarum TaxID=1716543 RepID=UPI0013D6625A|nr:branched-chain amino acid ABC transporter permease [Clostridium thermarum]